MLILTKGGTHFKTCLLRLQKIEGIARYIAGNNSLFEDRDCNSTHLAMHIAL
jgi:hypothetical protein